jgi:iron complex outermembrane recepter protein
MDRDSGVPMRIRFRRAKGAVAAVAMALALSNPSFAQSSAPATLIDVPAQPLSQAIQAVARQVGVNILVNPKLIEGREAPALKAKMSVQQALGVLLEGTGLTPRFVDEKTITLVTEPESAKTAASQRSLRIAQADAADRSATNAPSPGSDGQADSTAGSTMAPVLEEIVVSAQKRLERLQDVPVPVSVLKASTLVENNSLGVQDYFKTVPGLNFTGGNKNDAQLSIRGINGALNPTVGITVDDVPFGSSLFRSGGGLIPDLDPNDLDRIEILRGPQGTLYGVNSLGGLVKYVTVDPSTRALEGNLQAGIGSVSGGHETGYNLRGSVNVPVSSTFALRASGFTRLDPGYIDNPANGTRDVNRGEVAGGLLSALYRPSDELSIRLTALYQQKEVDGVGRIDPNLGDLQQTYVRGSGWARIHRESVSATVSGKWGSADITSLSGYSANRYRDSIDIANAARIAAANANFGVGGAHYTEDYDATKFSQELRLLVPLGERFDLLVGGFYTKEDFNFPTVEYAANPATGAQVGVLAFFDARGAYEEYAGFADLTVHFTDRFNIQFGGRKSRNEQEFSEVDTGVPQLIAGGRIVIPESVISESPFTYLVTPQLKISDELMVYARSASGYRAGGINPAFARGFAVPPGWKSDKTYTYELGAKGSLLARALSFDMSVFYIDWKDLQLNYTNSGVGYTSNGSRAKSEGVELSLDARPFARTNIVASMAYNVAEVTESFGASTARGNVGDRLPFASKLAGSVSVDQEFPLFGQLTGVAGVTAAYVGDRIGVFTGTGVSRQVYPSYTQVDLRMGARWDLWRVNAFVTNAGDKRGLIGGGIGQSNARLLNIIQPRTIGVSISRQF